MDILELLVQKLNLFSQYLSVTQKIYENDLYDNEDLFEERRVLAEKIDDIEENIKKILKKDYLSYSRDDLPQQEQQIFDFMLKIKSIVSRISELNEVIKTRMTKEIEELKVQIVKENTGNTAAASKYSGAYSTGDDYSSTRMA